MPAPRPRLDTWQSALLAYALFGLLICFFRLGAAGVMLTEGMVAVLSDRPSPGGVLRASGRRPS